MMVLGTHWSKNVFEWLLLNLLKLLFVLKLQVEQKRIFILKQKLFLIKMFKNATNSQHFFVSFVHFKNEYKMEEYLSLIDNPTIRKTFSQFRISNHKLQIGRGRYKTILREKRICKLCNSGEVENEYILALTCQKYEALRNRYNSIFKNLFYLENTIEGKQKLFEHAMVSEDTVLVNLLSKYILFVFAERDKNLKSIEE